MVGWIYLCIIKKNCVHTLYSLGGSENGNVPKSAASVNLSTLVKEQPQKYIAKSARYEIIIINLYKPPPLPHTNTHT